MGGGGSLNGACCVRIQQVLREVWGVMILNAITRLELL